MRGICIISAILFFKKQLFFGHKRLIFIAIHLCHISQSRRLHRGRTSGSPHLMRDAFMTLTFNAALSVCTGTKSH